MPTRDSHGATRSYSTYHSTPETVDQPRGSWFRGEIPLSPFNGTDTAWMAPEGQPDHDPDPWGEAVGPALPLLVSRAGPRLNSRASLGRGSRAGGESLVSRGYHVKPERGGPSMPNQCFL